MPNGWPNVPHYRQEFNYSCVAACVRMVLAHHEHVLAESAICQIIGTTPHGTAANDVARTTALGLDVQIGSSNLSQLRAALSDNCPPIVFLLTGALEYWNTNDAHAVVSRHP